MDYCWRNMLKINLKIFIDIRKIMTYWIGFSVIYLLILSEIAADFFHYFHSHHYSVEDSHPGIE